MEDPPALSTSPAEAPVIETSGPWPFVTRYVRRLADGRLEVRSSRHHRKRLALPEAFQSEAFAGVLWRCLWMPQELNWWIGVIFALGSFLFGLASVLSLAPQLAASWSLSPTQVNAIYFAGSIPFTTAAYLQLFQAANAAPLSDHTVSHRPRRFIGWRPHEIGWLSCALQFVGTILFNFNTFDAMIPSLTWLQQDWAVWLPDVVGSVLFLASGWLAFIEACHAHWAWRPRSLTWWVVFMNLLGCVGFMVSALFALQLSGASDTLAATLAIAFTLQGAVCFLAGSLLMLPETALEPTE